jgi:zinc protease
VLVFLPEEGADVVAARVVFRVGYRDDPPGQEGLTAAVAALMAEGTGAMDGRALRRAGLAAGSALTVHVGPVTTTFHLSARREVATRMVHLLLDVVTTPRMDPRDFEGVRREMVAAACGEGGAGWSWRVLEQVAWEGAAGGRPSGGTARSLATLTVEAARTHREGLFTRGRVAAGLAGGYPPRLEDQVREALSRLPAGAAREVDRVALRPAGGGPRVHLARTTGADTAVLLGFGAGEGVETPDQAALLVALAAWGLGRDGGARLVQARATHGLWDTVVSSLERTGLDGVPASRAAWPRVLGTRLGGVEVARVGDAVRVALEGWREVLAPGLSAGEVERARAVVLGLDLVLVQGQGPRLALALEEATRGATTTGSTLREQVASVTAGEVNGAVRRHLAPGGMVVLVVTPDVEGARAALAPLAGDLGLAVAPGETPDTGEQPCH